MSEKNQVVVQPVQSQVQSTSQQQQRSMTPMDHLKSDLTRMLPTFKMALPINVTPEKFLRILLNTVLMNPKFLECDRQSLFAAASKCAADGLFPDGREAAMIPYGREVQYQPMVGGIFKKIRNSGEIALLCADLVYLGDSFKYGSNSERGRYLDHQPELSARAANAKPIAVFGLSRTTDGEVDFEVMSFSEVEYTRSKSKAPNSPAWRDWWGEMAKKTVIKRFAKRLPMSADAQEALSKLNKHDDEEFDVELKPMSKLDELKAKLNGPKEDSEELPMVDQEAIPVQGTSVSEEVSGNA